MQENPQSVQVAAPPMPERAVFVEAPAEWGPGQLLITRLEQLGYRVADRRRLASRERRLELS